MLTFNLSVAGDKSFMTELHDPYQIMPATQAILSNKTLNSYTHCDNPGILIHINYVTRPFSEKALIPLSFARENLQMYAALADKIGTKNILIHMPCTSSEMDSIGFGMKVILDIFREKEYVIHFEIPSFKADFVKRTIPAHEYISDYLDEVISYSHHFHENCFKIVMDTAHLFANGCNVDDMILLIEKYKTYIEYIHLNGNCYQQYHSDKHVPIYSAANKFVSEVDKLMNYLKSSLFIMVAENTSEHDTWENWSTFASTYDIRIIEYNERLSL